MLRLPMYSLLDCYRNAVSNTIYAKLQHSASTENVEHADRLAQSREKCNYNSLKLLSLSRIVCDQAREEISHFNTILSAW